MAGLQNCHPYPNVQQQVLQMHLSSFDFGTQQLCSSWLWTLPSTCISLHINASHNLVKPSQTQYCTGHFMIQAFYQGPQNCAALGTHSRYHIHQRRCYHACVRTRALKPLRCANVVNANVMKCATQNDNQGCIKLILHSCRMHSMWQSQQFMQLQWSWVKQG